MKRQPAGILSSLESIFSRRNFSLLLLVSILILGTLLRSEELITRNYLFLIDQGRDMMAVKGIVFDHHPTLIGPYTSLQGVFQGPLWYYLLSIPTFLNQGDPWGTLVLMYVISISVVIVSFFWMRKEFGLPAGLITAFLLAISPEAVAAATYSWNPHPMWLLTLLYVIFMFELIKTKNARYHLFIWPIVGLMFHFQTALGVFFVGATLAYLLLFERSLCKSRYLLVGICLFFFLFLPQILFDLRHDFLMTKSVLNIFKGSDQGLFVGGESTSYKNLVSSHIHTLYANFRSGFFQFGYFNTLPVFLLTYIILSVAYMRIHKMFHKNDWLLIQLIGRLVILMILFSFLYPFPIRYWFLTGFQTLFILIASLSLSWLWKGKLGKIVLLVLFTALLVTSFHRVYVLYITPPDKGGVSKIEGKLEAIDFIYTNAGGKPFGLLVFTPPVNTDAYDYLLWWRGTQRYNYIPHKEKKGIFYLLIEPDPTKPWSYKGWIETVVKTGKVIETYESPYGFIIQKRSFQ